MILSNKVLFLIIASDCLIVDFLVKYFIDTKMPLGQKSILFPDLISIEKVYNTGAAFSMLEGNNIFLICVAVAILLFIFYAVFKRNSALSKMQTLAFALIAGGALGNLVDRVLYQHVIDFIQLEFVRFPIFNFADVFINIGVIILIFSFLVVKRNEERKIDIY